MQEFEITVLDFLIKELIPKFKKKLMQEFEITDARLLNYFIGINFDQRSEGIFIWQKKYVEGL